MGLLTASVHSPLSLHLKQPQQSYDCMGGRCLEFASKLHGNPVYFIDRAATLSPSTSASGLTMLSNKRCPNIRSHLYIAWGRQILPVFAHLFFVHALVGHSFLHVFKKSLCVWVFCLDLCVYTTPMVSIRRCQIPWDWSFRWLQATLGAGSWARVPWKSSQCSLTSEPALLQRSFICVLVEALLIGKHSSRTRHNNEQNKVLYFHLSCFVINILPDIERN